MSQKVIRILLTSQEYSPWWLFRFDFEVFITAFPILVPLGHLAYERFLSKPKPKENLQIDD